MREKEKYINVALSLLGVGSIGQLVFTVFNSFARLVGVWTSSPAGSEAGTAREAPGIW